MDVFKKRNSNGTVVALQLVYSTNALDAEKEAIPGGYFCTKQLTPGSLIHDYKTVRESCTAVMRNCTRDQVKKNVTNDPFANSTSIIR
jgi:hypothetical protein